MVLTILRGNEQIDVSVTPVLAKTGENNKLNYMLGIWVRDDMAGIGTMTYYDDNGNEIQLNEGKTYIAIAQKDRTLLYS